METNSIVKSFMTEKILKIDFVSKMSQKVYNEHFSVVYTMKKYRQIRISLNRLKEIFHSVSSPLGSHKGSIVRFKNNVNFTVTFIVVSDL